MLQKKKIPKLVHFHQRNENVDWEKFDINFPKSLVNWPKQSKRFAGCNSFGFGGANAHLVLEAFSYDYENQPSPKDSSNSVFPNILLLSAASENALRQKVADWVNFLKNNDGRADTFYNVLQTAAARATHHPHRLAVICESYQQTINVLEHQQQQGQTDPHLMAVAWQGTDNVQWPFSSTSFRLFRNGYPMVGNG